MTDPIRTALAHLRTNAVAYLALTVALGSTTAYAADKLVGPRDLAKNAVRGKHVKDGSLAAADFAPGALPAGAPRAAPCTISSRIDQW